MEAVHASLCGAEPLAALDQAEDMSAAGVSVPMIVHHSILQRLCAIGIRKGVLRAIETYFNEDEAALLRQLCADNPEIDRALSDFRRSLSMGDIDLFTFPCTSTAPTRN